MEKEKPTFYADNVAWEWTEMLKERLLVRRR
jgi:hypothetical protein